MKHYPHYLDLQPAMHAKGVVRLPGSKSISNRTLLLAALAQGTTHIRDLLASDDTHVMLMALQKLGVKWEQIGESQDYIVHGVDVPSRYIRQICSWGMRVPRYVR